MSSEVTALGDFHFLQVSVDQLKASRRSEISGDEKSLRKRRHHVKSRHGCIACRKRKVKCDEGHPSCQNCIKRREVCSLGKLSRPTARGFGSTSLPLEQSIETGLSPHVNMLQMKLFHHFNTITADTLVFDAALWRNEVMGLSFQHDFLMHAILLVSATHLSYLVPSDSAYHRAAAIHLSQTLRLFRHALAQPTTIRNADAFMATSTLLVHHAWATPDTLLSGSSSTPSSDTPDSSNTSRLDLSLDPLFSLAQGLREVFMTALDLLMANNSIFSSSTHHRPRSSIIRATKTGTHAQAELQSFFSSCYHRERHVSTRQYSVSEIPTPSILQSEDSPSLDMIESAVIESLDGNVPMKGDQIDLDYLGFVDASSRLVLVLALFQQFPFVMNVENLSPALDSPFDPFITPAAIPSDAPFPPISDLARYMFSFPTRSTNSFISLVRQNDTCALLILYFYYRAVELLLPERECWWSRRRAELLGPAIEQELLARGDGEMEVVLEEGKKLLGKDVGFAHSFKLANEPLARLLDDETGVGKWQRSRCLLEKLGWRGKRLAIQPGVS